MSRIGRMPIPVPEGVTVELEDATVRVRGPLGVLERRLPPGITVRAEEGVLRGGHIPTALSIPWSRAVDESGRFRSRAELEKLYNFIDPEDKTVVYCRIGERSSHTWFVLTHLLGKPGVRNYDGSWTEWGNTVRVPIVGGEEPGRAPGAVPA